jgi:hypothetical protein
MNLTALRRIIAGIALAAGLTAAVASCSIPTEDQPHQINREQTTTTVTATP